MTGRIGAAVVFLLAGSALWGEPLSLAGLVTPSTVIEKNGQVVKFAIHGFIEFKSLAEVFPYIDSQRQRWKGKLSEEELGNLEQALLREAIESRVISMEDERPRELLVTHTGDELRQAIASLHGKVPRGYEEAFLAAQEKWKHSLNCWSASPSIPGRVLSNWYPIEEGIELYGATYDSTEHFWQAVKYHPDVRVADLADLLRAMEQKDWGPWLTRLDRDPKIYLPNAYAVEFLRHNLARERLQWFLEELGRHGLNANDHARMVQQRVGASFRFSAFEEKVLWGDLADVLHLVYMFSLPDDPTDGPIRKTLEAHHFDAVYLEDRKMGFISAEFRSLMFEIWRVKYLKMARFREVISSIPMEIRLSHFLNDGDSPDIPIPVYVDRLNQIRKLARER